MAFNSNKISGKQEWLLTIIGVIVIIGIWWGLAEFLAQDKVDYTAPRLDDPAFAHLDRDSLAVADSIAFSQAKRTGKVYTNLPTPLQVVQALPKLVNDPKDGLISNGLHSIWLNIQGYFWAILFSIPIGFALGLSPIIRGMFRKPVDASRYLPLSALTGLFMMWFGLGDTMKVAFLAFGILVYMIPVVVQRVNEVDEVHLQTAYSLGASRWQIIRQVYLPAVLSKFIDDLRVLTAISWTYIIIAEILNRTGGLGSLIYIKARLSQTDAVFAILGVIILIGLFQDRVFGYLDKRFFPHKHFKTRKAGVKEVQTGLWIILAVLTLAILIPALTPITAAMVKLPAILICLASLALVALGEFKIFSSKAA